MNANLTAMKSQWEKLGIVPRFKEVHHSKKTLTSFYNHCKVREIGDENCRTLRRAEEVARLCEGGEETGAAIKSAWQRFPKWR